MEMRGRQRQKEPTTTRRRKTRAGAVAAAVVAALAVWALVELAFGVDLRAPAMEGSRGTSDVSALHVVVATGLASLAAWGLLGTLERFTPHARRAWTAIAALALVASLGGPLSGTGITTSNRLVLVLMHLVVAAVLIALLYRTAASGSASRSVGSHTTAAAYVEGKAA